MKLTPISLPTFGTDVSARDKAIAATVNGNRRNADVIAAIQFRRTAGSNESEISHIARVFVSIARKATE